MVKDLLALTPLRTSLIDESATLSYLGELDISMISKIYFDVLAQAGSSGFPAVLTEKNIANLLALKVS
jgi:hypothetical protein